MRKQLQNRNLNQQPAPQSANVDTSKMSDQEVMIAYMRAALEGRVPMEAVTSALRVLKPLAPAEPEEYYEPAVREPRQRRTNAPPTPEELKRMHAEQDKELWNKTKVCPHCGDTKKVGDGFGIKTLRNKRYAHSWCYQCRSTTSYNNKPRTYNSKNNR